MQPASDNRFPSPHPSPALMGAPAFYCTGEDNLQITTVDSNFPLSYTTRLRFLETSGQVNVYEFNTISLGSRLAHSSSFRLGEGWILNCDVVITGAGAQPAQSFIRVSVIRGLSGGTIEVATLVQGFANSIQRLAWPGSPIVTTIGQPGIIRTFTGTDPAAGAEISEAVPVAGRWRFISGIATLVTSATVANRSPRLTFDDGTTVWSISDPVNVQAASMTIAYRFQSDPVSTTLAAADNLVSVAPNLQLLQGWRIRTVTNNLQVGDNWGAPTFCIEEFLAADQ